MVSARAIYVVFVAAIGLCATALADSNIEVGNAERERALARSGLALSNKLVTLVHGSIDVREALQQLASFTEHNLVVGDQVGGSIALELRQVPWEAALQAILDAGGLVAHNVGNVLIADVADQLTNPHIRSDKHPRRTLLATPVGTSYTGDRVSLNFHDVELRPLLQLIADYSGLNLIASGSVEGRTSLRLRNVPWDQALDIILSMNGLQMRREGSVVFVAPVEELSALELRGELNKRMRAEIDALQGAPSADRSYAGKRISLTTSAIEIRAALTLLAEFADVNLVVAESVKGIMSLRLINVPWEQAFDVILSTNGLDVRRQGTVIVVAPAGESLQRMISEVAKRNGTAQE